MIFQGRVRRQPLAIAKAATGSLLLVAAFLLWARLPLAANNFQVYDGRLSEDEMSVSFTVSWDNAWNLDSGAIGNHDAVWFFVKYNVQGEFEHLNLSAADQHSSSDPSVLEVRPVDDGKGVFLVPTFSGGGQVPATTITLQLAAPLTNFYQIEFRAFGIEMVHVPEGDFWVGDSRSNNGFLEGNAAGPFLVRSEAEIPVGSSAGTLFQNAEYGAAANLPATWPKGFGGFYCMKYEISQAQYVDFLNNLTLSQQASVTAVPPLSPAGTLAMSTGLPNRNGIRVQYPGNSGSLLTPTRYGHDLNGDNNFGSMADGQNRACNWLNWADLTAYLDWAALRPMTEFEFEKACRGPVIPQPLEYAWGNDAVVDANTLHGDGTDEETATDFIHLNQGLASHGYDGPQGPLRCGFAAYIGQNRVQAGASYWGIMEMSGNLWEQCVTVNAAGLAFSPELGDGALSSSGAADVASWPGAEGAGFRGGGWNSGILPGFRDLAVSDRFYAGLAPTQRRNTTGGRGVR